MLSVLGVQHLADLSVQFMFKDDFHLSPARLGFYTGIISIPWIIKPFWGLLADSCPIWGSRR
jgi:hypothetical protein